MSEQPKWNGRADCARWDRELTALLEEFAAKSPSIGRMRVDLAATETRPKITFIFRAGSKLKAKR